MHTQKVLSILTAIFIVMSVSVSLNAQKPQHVADAYNWSLKNYKNDFKSAIDSMEFVDSLSTKLIESEELEGKLAKQMKKLQKKSHKYLPTFYFKFAYKLYKQKRTDMAIDKFKETVEMGKKYDNQKVVKKSKNLLPKLFYNAGTNGMQMMDYQKAINMFDKAVKHRPDWAEAYFKKALAYENAENDALMIKTIKKTIEVAKKIDNESTLKKAIRKGQRYYRQKGAGFIKESKKKEALSAFKKALEFDKKDPYSYYYIALADNKLFKYSKAVEAGNKALELLKPVEGDKEKAQQAKIYLELGIAKASLGKKEKGCEYLKKAEYGNSAEDAKEEQDSFECSYE